MLFKISMFVVINLRYIKFNMSNNIVDMKINTVDMI